MLKEYSKVGSDLIQAVEKGLSATHKNLPSWLLYGAEGDKIFQRIMKLSSYYVTRCEHQILSKHKQDILAYFKPYSQRFEIVELGAGDGTKTEVLIEHLASEAISFCYRPVDISHDILWELSSRLHQRYPNIDVQPINAEYFEALHQLDGARRKFVLFLGANIGNFNVRDSLQFLRRLSSELHGRDYALIGFDLKKDPRIIEAAYDDPEGVTREFNLNVLDRLNKEAGAEFDPCTFDHYASYNPQTGAAKSFLISLQDQDVVIKNLKRTFHFAQWETIHTVTSQKYDLLTVERLLYDANLEIVDLFFDEQHWFCDVMVKRR